jgi:predicted metal-dependent peptidase
MRLRMEACEEIKTFDIDGTRLRYNPMFAASLPDEELAAVLAHEVMHCALLHCYRRANRDPKLWNQACDYAINGQLVSAGFKLPADCLIDPQFSDLAADIIYARLNKQPEPDDSGQPQPQPGPGEAQPDQSSEPATGSMQDAPPVPQPGDNHASDWEIATEQANAVARGAGKMPGGIEENIDAARKCVEDWRAILREFVEYTVPSDYSWTKPNRRHVANGVYLPGMTRENLGHVAIAIDTSGSIDSRLLAAFSAELNAIMSEAKPDRVTVLYCDTQVNRIDEFGPDEEVSMHAVGRGGTAFCPIFDKIAQWGELPVCLIYFTDLDSNDKPSEPEYPVLWATGLSVTDIGPFGQTVRIAEHV